MATADPTLLGPSSTEVSTEGSVVERSPTQLFWMRFRKDKAAIAGAVFLLILVLAALFAPLIAEHIVGHGPNDLFSHEMTDEYGLPRGPNSSFWFGVDTAGRDIFVRVLYGARTSLQVAFIATGIATVIGVTLGLMAGFFGGKVDTIISRVIDIVLSLPLLLFAIGISAACSGSIDGCLGGLAKPGLRLVIFVIVLFSWTYIARIIRGQTLSLREREFVSAARSMGAGNARIMLREILPNLIAPIIIYGTLVVPANILFEASLSFLGLGVPQSIPSWGRMLSEASKIYRDAWWYMFYPGAFLVMTTLAFNLLGDGLRDALDPRSD